MNKCTLIVTMFLILLSTHVYAIALPSTLNITPPTGGRITSTPAGVIDCGTNSAGVCSAQIAPSTSVDLLATPDTGYLFGSWDGTITTNPMTISAGSRVSIFNFAPTFLPTFQLSTLITGNSAGTITSMPSGINCSSSPFMLGHVCQYDFEQTQLVTLSVAIGPTAILNWVGCDTVNIDNTCTMSMTAPKSVTANIVATTVTVSRTGSGAGSVTSTPGGISCGATCSAAFTVGSKPSFTAQPDPNSTFTGWGGDFAQAACAKSLTCAVTGDFGLFGPMNISANFELKQHLTTGFTGTGLGSIVSTPAAIDCSNVNKLAIVTSVCSSDFDFNSTVNLKATPVSTALIAGWNGCESNPTFDTCTVTMSSAKAVTVNILANTITVQKTGACTGTVTSTPAGIDCGSTCSKDIVYGTNPYYLTATADQSCVFTGWGGDFAGCGLLTNCSLGGDFGIIYPRTGTANFEMANNTLSVSTTGSTAAGKVLSTSGINCSTTSSNSDVCSVQVARGTDEILEAVPTIATTKIDWTGCDSVSVDGLLCRITPMNSPKNITANFIGNFTVTFATLHGGTINGIQNQTVSYGSSTSLVKAVPPSYQGFWTWITGAGFYSSSNPLTIYNVTSDMALWALFAPRAPTIGFANLQAAYNSAVTGNGGVLVDITQSGTPANLGAAPEFIAGTDTEVFIMGGYDALLGTRSGLSTVLGVIKINAGKVTIDGISVQ